MLQENDVFELCDGDSVYVTNFPQAFLCDNNDFNFQPSSGELHINGNQRGLDTSIFKGKYVVIKTTFDGGGNSHDGGYPDGHHVFAKKIIKDFSGVEIISKFEVNFYQSGCFTCMLPNKKALGVARPNKGIIIEPVSCRDTEE